MTAMKRERLRKRLGMAMLILAVALFLIGARRTHKAYDTDMAGFGILTYQRISERQLVEDATFSGVMPKDGRLVSTYDRSLPKLGKRACPT